MVDPGRLASWCAVIVSLVLFSGVAPAVAEDSDALYAAAAEAARNGDRAEARRLAVEVLVVAPDYPDATVLLARLDGWEGRYAPARDALARVIEKHPDHLGARKALVEVEYWSGRHERAEELCIETRRLLPDDDELKTRCSQVTRATTVKPPAKSVAAATVTAKRPTTESGPVESSGATYRTSIDYRNQSFDRSSLDSWHTLSLASERRDERARIVGRAGYVNRFEDSALQLDAEVYPKLGERTSAHVLASYATGDFLHDFKLWGELYQALPQRMEGSLGLRWSVYEDDVVGVTGSLAHYWKSWYFQGRFLVDTVDGDASGSGSVRARYSFDDPEESITGTVAFGNVIEQEEGPQSGAPPGTPDDVSLFEIESTALLLDWRKRVTSRYIAKLSFGTAFQDIEGDNRTQFLVGLGFEHLF